MSTIIDWVTESGKFLFKDRPEVFEDEAEAIALLWHWKNQVDDLDDSGQVASLGYVLSKYIDEDGDAEYTLSRILSTASIFFSDDSGETLVNSWTSGSAFKYTINLPDVGEEPS